MKKLVKYTTGGKINNYIEDPSTALSEYDRTLAEADLGSSTDPFVQGLNILSSIMGTAGNYLMSSAGSSTGKGATTKAKYGGKIPPPPAKRIGRRENKDGTYSTHLYSWGEADGGYVVFPTLFQKDGKYYTVPPDSAFIEAKKNREVLFFKDKDAAEKYAGGSWKDYYNEDGTLKKKKYGGKVPVEVEGGEVAETPSGDFLEFFGNSHAEGGIPTELEPGTEVYSDRISIDGKTMSDRKKARENKERKFKKLSDKGDAVAKKTLERVKTVNAMEDNLDRTIQGIIAKQERSNPQKMSLGDKVEETESYDNLSYLSQPENIFLSVKSPVKPDKLPLKKEIYYKKNKDPFSFKQNMTLGDVLGIGGNLYQAVTPYLNTLRNRTESTPNRNVYANFGEDAIKANEQAMDYMRSLLDNTLQGLELSAVAQRSRGRNLSSGVNTQRAMDIASEMAKNKGERDIYNDYASQIIKLLGQRAELENTQDIVVMSGEEKRDLANRNDISNYISDIGQSKMYIGEGVSNIGKLLNEAKQRNVTSNLLNDLFQYTGFNPYTGKLEGKGFSKEFAAMLVKNGKWKEARNNPNTEDGSYSSLEEFKKVNNLK